MRTTALGILSLSAASAAASAPAVCFADNPIVQTKFTADPAPMAFNNTLYLYTSHDEDDAQGFTMYNWLLYSTTDMANWTDHGIVAGVTTHSDSPIDHSLQTFQWADGASAWAPQAVSRNGKFYLYVPFQYQGQMVIGVAVATQPEGPFTDPLGHPLVSSNVGNISHIDPTVFVDDDGEGGDGQAYLYWGNPKPEYVRLNADMISYSGTPSDPGNAQHYQEGPWFYKRNGIYYLAYASTCCSEGIGYAMSTGPTGPWTNMGSGYVMMPDPNSSGNHPGIVDYMGHSYVFGFNYFLVNNLFTTPQYGPPQRRSVNVAQFTYNADGTIPTVPWFDAAGVAQIGHLNPYVRTEAETIAWESGPGAAECSSNTDQTANTGNCWAIGVKTEACSDTGGGMDVTSIQNGSYIKVKGVDFGAGALSFSARVASGGSGGNIELHLDAVTGTPVGTMAVLSTGGAQTWATQTTPVNGATGVHDLYFKFTGGTAGGTTGSMFKFNYWQFTSAALLDAGAMEGGSGGDSSIGVEPEGGSSSGSSGNGSSPSSGGASGGPEGGSAGSSSSGNSSASGCGCFAAGGLSGGAGAASLLVPVAFAMRRRRRAR